MTAMHEKKSYMEVHCLEQVCSSRSIDIISDTQLIRAWSIINSTSGLYR